MFYRKWLFLVTIILLGGCGTIQTLNPSYDHVEIAIWGNKSYCKAIPRIYSGTFFQVCKLYAAPNYEENVDKVLPYDAPNKEENVDTSVKGFPFFIYDIPLSFVLDTVVIPYTATRQYIYGGISVN
ncbi:MAG: YceK/YidQ family lipoprotein [Thermodesulfobacteriota bacterium]